MRKHLNCPGRNCEVCRQRIEEVEAARGDVTASEEEYHVRRLQARFERQAYGEDRWY